MRYFRAYQYFFDSPKWGMNLLWGSLCMLIPVLGGIVFSGYGFEVIESMHGRGGDGSYPEFDFNRFVKYLVRGCWPFIWQLIIGLPIGFLYAVLYLVTMAIVLATGDGHGPNAGVLVGMIILDILFILVVSLLIGVVGMPLILRAGLSQEFGFSGASAFVQEFLKRVWKEVLLAELFVTVTGAVLIIAGEICCIIPVFPATVLVVMAQSHLMFQIYELYLQRGGAAVPIKLEVEES